MGASGDGVAVLQALQARYSEPHRKYHTLQHLAECLAWLDTAQVLAEHPHEVALALWFHDAIYEVHVQTGVSGNEARSAEWAVSALAQAGVATPSVARIESLIMATCHTALPVTPDEQVLVDIDLSILGADPQRFAQYEQQIRDEYAHVPDPVFKPKRREILSGFLARPRIYATAYFYDELEARARENLRTSLFAGPLARIFHAPTHPGG